MCVGGGGGGRRRGRPIVQLCTIFRHAIENDVYIYIATVTSHD